MNYGYGFGHHVEDQLREILPFVGFPHRNRVNGKGQYFWWANRAEDWKLGIDCWLTSPTLGEVAVDFTVLKDDGKIQAKIQKAMSRGIVPVILEARMVEQAHGGNPRALDEMRLEIEGQVACRMKQLNGIRMTRRVAQRTLEILASNRRNGNHP